MTTKYTFLRITTDPRQWKAVADTIAAVSRHDLVPQGPRLYGIWRSQIGRPRDELSVMLSNTGGPAASDDLAALASRLDAVRECEALPMTPTLRPADATPPRRQGNYAFRWFETPASNFDEFLALCAGGWPGFEAAYDSQVIGLWRIDNGDTDTISSLLVTRRPDLAMWERSKIPANEDEAEVRRKLSRRYDLCDFTIVHTATLLTATDREDTARWT